MNIVNLIVLLVTIVITIFTYFLLIKVNKSEENFSNLSKPKCVAVKPILDIDCINKLNPWSRKIIEELQFTGDPLDSLNIVRNKWCSNFSIDNCKELSGGLCDTLN